jgi:hypothetical protein
MDMVPDRSALGKCREVHAGRFNSIDIVSSALVPALLGQFSDKSAGGQ